MGATWQDLRNYLIAMAESYDFDMTRYSDPFTQALLSNLEDFLEALAKGIDDWWEDWNIGHGGEINADQVDSRHYSEFLLVDLADTLITSPQDGHSLIYDNDKWRNKSAGDGTFAGLTDTNIDTPADGEVAVYRDSDDKWHNESASAVDDKKVKATSTDPTPGYLDAKRTHSIVVSSNNLQLSGDAASPGNEKYYGTNISGTKGFYDFPAASVLGNTITFSIEITSWINQPSGLTEFLGKTNHRTKVDLSNALQARLTARVTKVGVTDSALRVQYSTDESIWVYLDAGTGPTILIDSIGTQVSAWVSLTALAKADVFLRLVGIYGDAAEDPTFGLITVQFK